MQVRAGIELNRPRRRPREPDSYTRTDIHTSGHAPWRVAARHAELDRAGAGPDRIPQHRDAIERQRRVALAARARTEQQITTQRNPQPERPNPVRASMHHSPTSSET